MYPQTSDFLFLSKNKLESLLLKLKWIGKPPNSFYVKALIYFFSYENIIHNYCFTLNVQLLLNMTWVFNIFLK